MEPFLNCGGAFRPQIVKVRALSAPTKEILLKYSLDLPYAQTGNLSINSLNFPLFSRLPAIENSIYVSFSLVFALMG